MGNRVGKPQFCCEAEMGGQLDGSGRFKKIFFDPHPRTFFMAFREKGGEEGREKRTCKRGASIACLLYMPGPGTEPQPRYVP